jgi:hypothetical protein
MEIEICSGFDGGISFCLTTQSHKHKHTQTYTERERERESEPDSSVGNEREDQFYNTAAEMVGDHFLAIFIIILMTLKKNC